MPIAPHVLLTSMAFSHNHQEPLVSNRLPDPRLTKVYRLEATLAQPFDLGEIVPGHRRIVPLTGGTFTGPELNGKLLPGASADWQIILPDGTALGDIRYTLADERRRSALRAIAQRSPRQS